MSPPSRAQPISSRKHGANDRAPSVRLSVTQLTIATAGRAHLTSPSFSTTLRVSSQWRVDPWRQRHPCKREFTNGVAAVAAGILGRTHPDSTKSRRILLVVTGLGAHSARDGNG
jgi:hypothetical protein